MSGRCGRTPVKATLLIMPRVQAKGQHPVVEHADTPTHATTFDRIGAGRTCYRNGLFFPSLKAHRTARRMS